MQAIYIGNFLSWTYRSAKTANVNRRWQLAFSKRKQKNFIIPLIVLRNFKNIFLHFSKKIKQAFISNVFSKFQFNFALVKKFLSPLNRLGSQFSGLPGSNRVKRQNLSISSFKKGQKLKIEAGQISKKIFLK